MWKALCTKHKGTLIVFRKGKEIPVKIHGWYVANAITYPILKDAAGNEIRLGDVIDPKNIGDEDEDVDSHVAGVDSYYRIKK
jgi:hypothetical protein